MWMMSAVFVVGILVWAAPACAGPWAVPLGTPGGGQSGAQGAPSAPTGVSAACLSPLGATIKVTWTLVTEATSFTIYDSTTSATGGYAIIASGVAGATWTSGTLSTGNYWFEVVAHIGINWASVHSTATAESTIAVLACL